MFYKLTNQTSNTITFQVPVSVAGTTVVDLGVSFTATKSLASDPAGFIAELDAWLRSHQPGTNGLPGMILNWHAEYINNIPLIICDNSNARDAGAIKGTGMTTSIMVFYPPPIGYNPNLPIKCGAELSHGILLNADAMIAGGGVRTPTSTVTLTTPGDPVTEDAFNNSSYCTALRAAYTNYMDYVRDRVMVFPTMSHKYFTDWHNKSHKLSHDMASYTYPNIDGVVSKYYPMCAWAIAPDESARASAVNSSFDWYMPGVIEGYEYCCDRGTTMDDTVWSTMGKISSNQNTLSNIRLTTALNSYKYENCSWRMYRVANLSYGGGTHDPYNAIPRLSFADYDLTRRT